jgi:AcrR family transcriptional regulator
MSITEQPRRKDAARNRQRILNAAKELFAERGLDVTLHDIARAAGVGVGTVYRHFSDKKILIDLLFEEQLEESAALFEQGLQDPDPWHAVVDVHTRMLELQASDRGLRELLLGMPDAPAQVAKLRAKLHPLAAKLISRAKQAGAVRPDCQTTDFGVVQLMVGAVIAASAEVDPELWRRYLTIALQGLRPAELLEPLAPAAPKVAQMEQLLVGAWNSRHA